MIKKLNFDFTSDPKASVLIIYTGGTLGMDYDPEGALVPSSFDRILSRVPVIKELNINLSVISIDPPIDSSNVNSKHWINMCEIIKEYHQIFDGFIILHGTDTMAYSASALSFMLQGINKPVIFTGAQLPVASPRSDGTENFVTALEIAADRREGKPVVSEVCIFFNHVLLRGNRSKKVETGHFDAFESEHHPILAKSGITIDYNYPALQPFNTDTKLSVHKTLDNAIATLKLFPGISMETVKLVLEAEHIKGIVLESYGSGNVPHQRWFLDTLAQTTHREVIVLNISQCSGGNVMQGRYETSSALDAIGVLSGRDMTFEAAITKMMYALGRFDHKEEVKKCLTTSVSGEMN